MSFDSQDSLNKWVEEQQEKLVTDCLSELPECLTKKHIDKLLSIADSYSRWNVFTNEIVPRLEFGNKIYWYALKGTYDLCDNLYPYKEEIKKAFSVNIPGKRDLMNKEEKELLRSLPETVTIYRGMTEAESISKDYGVSWTLNKEVAQFFAFQYRRNHATQGKKKVVEELTINKKDIVAIFLGRKEFEVIYLS